MTLVLPALSVTFAAICVWLTVRIVNRRERWAKWAAVAVLVYAAYFTFVYHLGRAEHWFDRTSVIIQR